MSVTCSQ